jgi:hypothetical protein
MKLLRDSFDWRTLRQRLFSGRAAARRSYVVTVPAPLARGSSAEAWRPPSTDGVDVTVASAAPAVLHAAGR